MNQTQQLSAVQSTAWRVVQWAVFVVGVVIVGALLFKPKLGLYLLWDVLIPVAPLLLVVAPGIWRNVCPLGTFSMLPHRFGLSKKRILSRRWQGIFFALAVVLLLVIVPLRHVLLDVYGVVTGIVLLVVAAAAFVLGMVFDWKSAWCSGLCPVYPVEMLYGTKPLLSVPNVQCATCTGCVSPCRDSKIGATPLDTGGEKSGRIAGSLLVGGFPGFVLGWYLVELPAGQAWWLSVLEAYAYPFAGMLASLVVYTLFLPVGPRRVVNLVFATAAVSIYYWFKLPVVLGLLGDPTHALIELRGTLAPWTVWVFRVGIIGVLTWLLLGRGVKRGWTLRPPSIKAAKQT
jgi:hypothetical protein